MSRWYRHYEETKKKLKKYEDEISPNQLQTIIVYGTQLQKAENRIHELETELEVVTKERNGLKAKDAQTPNAQNQFAQNRFSHLYAQNQFSHLYNQVLQESNENLQKQLSDLRTQLDEGSPDQTPTTAIS